MGDMEMMSAIRSFYAGRRVLVTGHTGFKGSWLAQWLVELGAEVTGFALPPSSPDDHFACLGLERRIVHRTGDIRDAQALSAAFAAARPEVVFHLAAQALVRRSYAEPKLTFDTNVGGSVNVLEAVRETPSVRAVVYITSDKCYRNRETTRGYCESDELGGDDPYSASKAAAELVYHAYVRSFFSPAGACGVASARAGNVIGGGDWSADRIVPDAIRALRAGTPVTLRNPDSTRPWQHVLDPLSGYLRLGMLLHAAPARYSSSWNFGPQADAIRTVKTLADAVVHAWGGGTVTIEKQAGAPHEAGLLHLDCGKSNRDLGWRPQWDFDMSVARTVEWYRTVTGGATTADVTSGQIRAYMEATV